MKKNLNSKNISKYVRKLMLNNSPLNINNNLNKLFEYKKNNFKDNLNIFLYKKNIFDNKIALKRLSKEHGLTKHFSPSVLEWDSNIYSYNKNYNKLLTTADNKLMSIVRSYFIFRFRRLQKEKKIRKAILYGIRLNKFRKSRSKLKFFRNKRLTINKILIAKGNVKHTNDSAIITLFIFNLEKKNYKLFSFYTKDYLRKLWIFKRIALKRKEKSRRDKAITYWETHLKIRYRQRKIHRKLYFKLRKFIILKLKSKYLNLLNNNEKYIVKGVIIKEGLLDYYFNNKLNELKELIISMPLKKNIKNLKYNYHWMKMKYLNMWWTILRRSHEHIIFIIFNGMRFQKKYIENLRKLATKIYNKNIILNIVPLKNYYFNSDIYTQILTLKLRNRKFGLSNLLGKSLSNIKIPRVHKMRVKIDISKLWRNKINHNIILDIAPHYIRNNLWLDELLLNNHSSINPLSLFGKFESNNSKLDLFRKKVLKSLKDKTLAGIRVEVRGRLTRRFKASRAMYKLKWIGGLRNIDSSYKGLSSVILRGHHLPNVQYTVMSSKRRIGAYGVKGWVSSM